MLLKPRSLRKSLLALLALFVVLTATPVTSASAHDDVDCSPPWDTRVIPTGKSVDIVERCEPVTIPAGPHNEAHTAWRWVFLRFQPADRDQTERASRASDSPAYWMEVQGIFGGAAGGGAAGGGILITGRDGSNLDRRIAARTITEIMPPGSSFFYNCRDTGWVEAATPRSWMAAWINQYREPDCGAGTYRTQFAGRFWSLSLNTWITSQWHYTNGIYLSVPTVATEPTVTPTPEVTSLE